MGCPAVGMRWAKLIIFVPYMVVSAILIKIIYGKRKIRLCKHTNSCGLNIVYVI